MNQPDNQDSNIPITTDKPTEEYRVYEETGTVAEFYKENHEKQTFEHVQKMKESVFPLGRWKLDILEVIKLMDDIVDNSDPDLNKQQIIHCIQTGEACKAKHPDKDWFHLLGFMHDLGKILCHPKMHNLPQWSVVGDIFPVGCAFSEKCVYPQFFRENPDFTHEVYSTKNGVYVSNCGFDNVTFGFSHDFYLYAVLMENENKLPIEAKRIIRYHSFYPWHQEGAYDHLADQSDWELLPLLKDFQKCDLYSKSEVEIDVEKMLPYYIELIEKYFPNKVLDW